MPYSSKMKFLPADYVTITQTYSSGSTSFTNCERITLIDGYTNLEEGYSRSGTNTNTSKIPLLAKPVKQCTPVLRFRRIPGKRLAYKVYDFKTRRYYWARDYIKVPYIKCVFMKSKKKSKKKRLPLFTKPNQLDYIRSSVSYYGATKLSSSKRGDYSYTVEGPLHNAFRCCDNGASSAYTSANVSLADSQPFTSMINQLDSQALSLFYSRVKDQSVNLAQCMVERKQTINMFADVVSRIAKTLTAAKHGNISGALGHLLAAKNGPKQVANDFLALQFGLRPLLSDLDGIAKALAEGVKSVYDIKASRHEKVSPQLLFSDSCNRGPRLVSKIYTEGDVTVTYHATISAELPHLRALSQLGFGNLASLAWEVIPYSFIVDWVLPVGGYINAMDAFSGLSVLHVHRTVYFNETVTCERIYGGLDQNWYDWENATAGFQVKKVVCRRTPLTTVPSLPFPDFKDPLSLTHIADALSLLAQLKIK